ncbi:MAG: NAD(P)/FAD-dependent oxidoreductase [bacterium]
MKPTPISDRTFDVVIAGGGLAGLTLALQLRQRLPAVSVAVVEPIARPLPPGAHKVGESSVELGSVYLRQLGLRDYLHSQHVIKLALRFFPGGGELPLHARDELGPAREPLMVSYQMDRGKLETDLRAMIEAAGATLYEGARVTAVERAPGDTPHTLLVEQGDTRATLTARWLIDATGRRALLRRLDGTTRRTTHLGNAGWFRVTGKLDISAMVDPSQREWFERPIAEHRWRSTNHLMGDGYWVWLIPLADGRTSVGIVAHEPRHDFDRVRSYEACLGFLDEFEPVLARSLRDWLDNGEELLDFKCLKRYSYGVDRWMSADRWAVVGEAGAFLDPLYSPGTDSIGLSNSYAVEAIAADFTGGDLAQRVEEMHAQLDALVTHGFHFFDGTGGVYGHARAMTAKYYWDNFIYWNYHCQHFAQGIHRLTGEELEAFIPLRERFFALNTWCQILLRRWAGIEHHTPGGQFISIPRFPSVLIQSNLAILNEMDPEGTFDYMTLRVGQAERMLVELVLRVLTEIGPEKGAALIEATGLRDWDLRFPPARVEAEALDETARRERLDAIGRDVADHIYPFPRHPDAAAAARLVLAERTA